MTRSRQTGDGQPVRLRSTPVTARMPDGRTFPAQVVTPLHTRAELRDIVRGERDRGWLTRGQARRIIARDKAQNIMDGPGSREPTPRTRTRGRSR